MTGAGPLESRLTDDGILIAHNAAFDLGVGYPQIPLPAWLRDTVAAGTDVDLTYSLPSQLPAAEAAIDRHLLEAVCRLLAIPEHLAAGGFITFSGSVALDRVLVSVVRAGDSVLTTSPSIDMVTAMISEHAGVEAICVPAMGPGLDIELIAASVRPDTRCIVLSSPDNPTGRVIGAEEMTALVALAVRHDLTLVLDQCFALVNPHAADIGLLPNFAVPELKWAMLWDTGKTFGLNHEKLGFIFCSPQLRRAVSERLNILQYDISRRHKLLFRAVLDGARSNHYAGYLSGIVATNLGLVRAGAEDLPLEAASPEAGSVVLLDVTGAPGRPGGSAFADMLLAEKGIGVIKARAFFHPLATGRLQPEHDDFIRIALARQPELLRTAMARVAELCDDLGNRLRSAVS